MMKSKKVPLILSIIVTVALAMVPGIGRRTENGNHIFGFPADSLGYYGDWGYSFLYLGLLFNLVFFYFLFVMFNRLWMFVRMRR